MIRLLSGLLTIAIISSVITRGVILTSTAKGEAAAGVVPISITTMTPIKHIIVIFQENTSFDHYFGTYPNATNPNGEPRFIATLHTPTVNGLTEAALKNNSNGNYCSYPPHMQIFFHYAMV